ncbi:MAG: hypothetical protein EBR88_02340, partial [Betaproteobacteria bacterium]|nr:hypothetical protein [Betaproteobacteria bacterium]
IPERLAGAGEEDRSRVRAPREPQRAAGRDRSAGRAEARINVRIGVGEVGAELGEARLGDRLQAERVRDRADRRHLARGHHRVHKRDARRDLIIGGADDAVGPRIGAGAHHHADHAFGAWALFAAGMKPRVVAQQRFIEQLEYDMKTAGLIARNNNQFPEDVPRSWVDAIRPTQTFDKNLTLVIGGESFHLQHARGETEDHLWVHVPSRNLVVTGDLFQDFLPNVGNGKRRVRFASDWANALRAISATNSDLLLPMHGPALTDRAEISRRLGNQADMLDSIVKQVLDGLNSGLRQDQVVEGVALSDELSKAQDARELYVTVKDAARMVVKEHSGWWDDIPSNWSPAPLRLQAEEIVRLSGGLDRAIGHAKGLSESNSALAIKFADWIWLAHPTTPKALRACLEIYSKHVSTPKPTQEALIYAEHMIRLEMTLAQTEQAAEPLGAR